MVCGNIIQNAFAEGVNNIFVKMVRALKTSIKKGNGKPQGFLILAVFVRLLIINITAAKQTVMSDLNKSICKNMKKKPSGELSS